MKNRRIHIMHLSMFLFSIIFFSCSLRYEEDADGTSDAPTFIFRNAVVKRYANGKQVGLLTASRLEQYDEGNALYAKDAVFQAQNEYDEVETEGSCTLLAVNEDICTLFQDVSIFYVKKNIHVYAQALRWNNETKQLTGSTQELVHISKDDLQLEGYAFAADGITQDFCFYKSVDGTMQSDEEGAR